MSFGGSASDVVGAGKLVYKTVNALKSKGGAADDFQIANESLQLRLKAVKDAEDANHSQSGLVQSQTASALRRHDGVELNRHEKYSDALGSGRARKRLKSAPRSCGGSSVEAKRMRNICKTQIQQLTL